jgi:hypothetical protein
MFTPATPSLGPSPQGGGKHTSRKLRCIGSIPPSPLRGGPGRGSLGSITEPKPLPLAGRGWGEAASLSATEVVG